MEESPKTDSNKRGKDLVPSPEPNKETPTTVQPVEELLTIELTPGDRRKDLEGIDPGVITHHLNLDPSIKLVKQKKRHFGLENDKIIQEEVNKLLSVKHIKEIQFPKWLSNIVLVPKPGGKSRMCIDFQDLNKVCPKNFYPLPTIDQLVDSTSRCELLSMMNASQEYHQIMLAPEDHKRLGRNMEVYVDDMLVKSKEAHNHMEDPEETFKVLRNQLKLNPDKYVFGVSGGRFLGFMVTQRGIGTNPILDMGPPPASMKYND
ncbi:hypothetical protein Sango_1918400 [Sesamum angolense]|uniref:Reverse transcriptase domain-containing protein n=1 Tax=Sesamum angolense TaxID=2727404 RepID=A0AAE1WDM5_9LAMI|nr:hypothetical protein Sango_1918400 [Sesamum angolense]